MYPARRQPQEDEKNIPSDCNAGSAGLAKNVAVSQPGIKIELIKNVFAARKLSLNKVYHLQSLA
jgi:hypothetical protein